MKILFDNMKFGSDRATRPIAAAADSRAICFADDKEFYVQKKGPNGQPVFKRPKKGPNAGQLVPEQIKMSLLIRGCEIEGVIYQATNRSSTIKATRPDGSTSTLTAIEFAKTAARCCGAEAGRRACLHVMISDRLMATYQGHARHAARS
jgi:hypothetical protein